MTEANEPDQKTGEHHRAEHHSECYCMGAGPAFSKFARMLEPPGEAGRHFRQARIEFLKGIRELIDYRIEKLSREYAKGTKVPVD